MTFSPIDFRVARLQAVMNQVDHLNKYAKVLISLIEEEDRKEKDQVRYGGVLGR